mmetsp:Transcript_28459/g.91896  ORF Transcript_28459/g.91896 Transcript_28459/m.91896 type:complete len:232 (-) Transcript_28459:1817-2512(-)
MEAPSSAVVPTRCSRSSADRWMGASSMCGMGTSSAAEPRPKPRLLSWWKVMQMRTGCSSSRLKYCSRSGAPYRSSALVEAESRRPRCLRVRGTTFRGMTPSVDARQSAPTGAGSSYLAALSSRIRLGMRAAKRKSSRACTSVGSAANSSSSSRHETYSHQSTAPPRVRSLRTTDRWSAGRPSLGARLESDSTAGSVADGSWLSIWKRASWTSEVATSAESSASSLSPTPEI